MNREIKFRAWDKEVNKMTYFDLELLQNSKDTTKLSPIECYDKLMQFTGLKDKKEKEIYEGDIVKSTNKELGECIAVVGFNEKESAFVLLEGYGWQRPDEFFSTWNKVYEFEVIGNIYENPELLNDVNREKGEVKK